VAPRSLRTMCATGTESTQCSAPRRALELAPFAPHTGRGASTLTQQAPLLSAATYCSRPRQCVHA